MTAFIRQTLDPRTWTRILYLLLALPLGVVEFSVLVTAISFGFGTADHADRHPRPGRDDLDRALAREPRAQPDRAARGRGDPEPVPPRSGRRPLVAAHSRAPLRPGDLEGPRLPAAPASARNPIVHGHGDSARRSVLRPAARAAYYWALPGRRLDRLDRQSTRCAEALAVVPVGALILLFGIPGLAALARLYGWLAAQLLGSNADPALTAQVTELQDARSRIIAAADAERRRHRARPARRRATAPRRARPEPADGASSGAAEGDPSGRGAGATARGEEAQLALNELRDLARGIHPAILTEPRADAALEDLASRATVPVELTASAGRAAAGGRRGGRLLRGLGGLANIGKHAEATSATVDVRRRRRPPVGRGGRRRQRQGRTLAGGSGHPGPGRPRGRPQRRARGREPAEASGTRVTASIPLTDAAAAADTAVMGRAAPRVLPDRRPRRSSASAVATWPPRRLASGSWPPSWSRSGRSPARPALDRVAAARHRAGRRPGRLAHAVHAAS